MFNIFKSSTKEFEGKNFYNYSARNSNGEEISMTSYLGKVVLVVNVASQYEEVEHSALNFPTTGLADENFKQLVELDKRYRNDGLIILGFPTNQFGGQEPAIQEEIVSFIHRKYNVGFEIFQKVDVNGPNTLPLFDYLKNVLPGTITNDLKWHFTKFLVDRNGNPVKRYAPNEAPFTFEEEIRHLLRQESILVKGMEALQGQDLKENLPGKAGLQGQIIPPSSSSSKSLSGLRSEKGWLGELDKGKSVSRESRELREIRNIDQDRAYWEEIERNRLEMQRQGIFPFGTVRSQGLSGFSGLSGWKGKSVRGQPTIEEDRAYWEEIERNRLDMQRQGIFPFGSNQWMGKISMSSSSVRGQPTIEEDRAYWEEIERNRMKMQGLELKEWQKTPSQTSGGFDLQGRSLKHEKEMQYLREREAGKQTYARVVQEGQTLLQTVGDKVSEAASNVKAAASNVADKASQKFHEMTGVTEQQEGMGFKKQEDLTGEGGKIGAQMGIHFGAHSLQAGIQAGKDPQKTQEQTK